MIWIGISGFRYAAWKGIFYPDKMPATKMLAFYAQHFPTTEINYTFRRWLTDNAVANWMSQTPAPFRFTLKVPQQITHYQRLKDCEALLQRFADTAFKFGPKRGALLFQLPPDFKCNLPVLERFLTLLPSALVSAFEFRHASWLTDPVFELLRGHNATLCIADTEDLTTPTVFTSATGYFRLRRGVYASDDLRRWAETIHDHAARLTDIYVYLKHEDAGTGPRLAKELMDLLGLKRSGAAPGEQGLLFDE